MRLGLRLTLRQNDNKPADDQPFSALAFKIMADPTKKIAFIGGMKTG